MMAHHAELLQPSGCEKKARPYAQMVEADGGDAPATEADAVVDAPPTESTLADGVEKALAGEAEGGGRREVSLGID